MVVAGAAAGYGGKVPLPGAHANAPPGGSAASDTGKQRLVSVTTFAAHNKRGFAPRTNVRELLAFGK